MNPERSGTCKIRMSGIARLVNAADRLQGRQAQVTLYAAEVDAVLTRRLRPRSLKSGKGGPVRQDEKAGTTTL
jgi:hypothetical protein